MSWNDLLKSINEEVGTPGAVISSKKPKERILFDRIARELLEDRVDEIDLKAAGEKVAGAAKKVVAAVKHGWQALAGKIKEVATLGFRLGVAVGKTLGGKFVLFNKSGKILTPEAEHAEYKRVASGKKMLTLTYKTKSGPMDIHLADRLDKGFGTELTHDGDGIFFVVEPKTAGVAEDVDYDSSEVLSEAEEDYSTLSDVDKLVFGSFADEGSAALKASEEQPHKIVPVEVTYEDFSRELADLLKRVKEGTVLKGSKIKNLAIYAPTGWGKTEIIGKAAKANGYHFFPLELQKVPVELLTGFPYLEDTEGAEDDVKEDRLRRAMKIVKMAPSQFLPPSGSPDSWLLFFDEFNRADMEKMSAVMNLLLTGELGGASELVTSKKSGQKTLERYKLPKKVVVVLAMNTGTQKSIADSINAVKDMDIATLERVHRVLHGKYHAVSWFKSFAMLPYAAETESGKKFITLSRIPPIVLNFIQQEMKTKTGLDPEKPFLLPIKVATGEPGMGGGERTSSPRSWTMIADDMIERGIEQWNSLSKEAQDKFTKTAEKMKKQIEEKWPSVKEKDPDADKSPPDDINQYKFAAWFNSAANQIRLLAMESPELGDEGKDYVGKMIRSFIKRGKEGITEEDILFNYKAIRDQVKNLANIGFGTKPQLLARLYNSLSKYKSEEDIVKFMEEKGIPILSKQGMVEQLYQTFKAMYKDLDFDADDFIGFTHLIESAAKEDKSKLFRQLHAKMAGKWEVYVENLKKSLKTKSQVEKELEAISKGGKAGAAEAETPEEKQESKIVNFLKSLKVE